MTPETYSDAPPPDPLVIQKNQDRLMEQLGDENILDDERKALHQRFAGLIEVVTSWAISHNQDVDTIKPLGGGFKNPVLLLTTVRGEQFVAKGFTEEQSLTTTKEVQQRLNTLFSEDERLIPKSEIFNDTLFSEKAKGSPIKELIAEAVADPGKTKRTTEAFYAVGATLGMLHERTERPIPGVDDLSQQLLDQVTTDRDKISRHLDELSVGRLIGIDAEGLDAIKQRVNEFTEPEYVSLVHGDAHLDQFFHEDGGATVEIVDYDDIREGDPMADLGRLISSERDWCRAYGASGELETRLIRSVAAGYGSARKESGLLPAGEEFDMMRVVAYELRLQLVKLKNYSELRQRMATVEAHLGLREHEIVTSKSDEATVIGRYLTPEDQTELQNLRVIAAELTDILTYLRPVHEAQSPRAEHIAA